MVANSVHWFLIKTAVIEGRQKEALLGIVLVPTGCPTSYLEVDGIESIDRFITQKFNFEVVLCLSIYLHYLWTNNKVPDPEIYVPH